MRLLTDNKKIRVLIVVTWITYFSTYLGRLNFSASINEIAADLQMSKGTLGGIASVFFLAYGVGQLFSGILGDCLPSSFLVTLGVAGAAVMNLIFGFLEGPWDMKVVWFLNGLFQSLTWAPMAKWISDRVDKKICARICLLLSTTGPAGMLCSYLVSALCIHYFNWRTCFTFIGAVIGGIAVIWGMISLWLEKQGEYVPEDENAGETERPDFKLFPVIVQSGLMLIAVSACIHGVLKDGISTWVPTYLAENYSLTSFVSIILTMILPVINLTGVYLADWWNQNCFHTEMKTAAAFFGVTVAAVLGMGVCGKNSVAVSILFFAIITTCMTGINTLLVSLIPLHFKRVNKVATVIGLINSVTYLGTAIGSCLFGILAENYGWGFLRGLWCVLGVMGAGVSWSVWKRWNGFRAKW